MQLPLNSEFVNGKNKLNIDEICSLDTILTNSQQCRNIIVCSLIKNLIIISQFHLVEVYVKADH